MTQASILEAVAERDIDLVILEELAVNPRFLLWWLDEVGGAKAANPPVLVRARHSVTHRTLGESDLVIVYTALYGQASAVLIENKINAPAQPEQALRYRQRGEAGIQAEDWFSFRTCILAPRQYLQATSDAALYDKRISYEDVRDWLNRDVSDPRSQFRARILDEAIEQGRRRRTPEPDERVTAFWRAYWECVSKEFPEFELGEPGPRAAGSDWIEIRPEALGPGRRIYHKLLAGYVDLQIDGSADSVETVRQSLGALLGSDTTVEATGKSSSVRVVVSSIDRFKPFEDQLVEARTGMRAAFRLLYMSRALAAA